MDTGERYKIDSKTNCYEWLEPVIPNKYAQIKLDGKVYDIYRLVAEIFIRPLKEGDRIMHSCDNKKCINPEHLNVVPYEENILYCWDGIKPGEDKKISSRVGEDSFDPLQSDILEKLSKSYNLSKKQVVELALNNLNEMTEVLDSLIGKGE